MAVRQVELETGPQPLQSNAVVDQSMRQESVTRKQVPAEPINKRMGEPRGKQMGQKSVKFGRRGGHGSHRG